MGPLTALLGDSPAMKALRESAARLLQHASDRGRLPPVLIQVGSDEILRDDAVRMADKLRAAGGEVRLEEWPRMPHAWHHYARIMPEARHAIERIGAFVQTQLN